MTLSAIARIHGKNGLTHRPGESVETMLTVLLIVQGVTTMLVVIVVRPLLRLENRLTRIETALERFERCDICPYKGEPTLTLKRPHN